MQQKGQGWLEPEREESRGSFPGQETPASENLKGEAPQTSQLLVDKQRVLLGRHPVLNLQGLGPNQRAGQRQASKPLVASWGQEEMRHKAEASAGPVACNLGPEGLPAVWYLLAAKVTPQNRRFSLKLKTMDPGISLVGQPGPRGQEGPPKSLRSPRAAFEAEIQSIFEDSCSVCGKVGKMFKIQ